MDTEKRKGGQDGVLLIRHALSLSLVDAEFAAGNYVPASLLLYLIRRYRLHFNSIEEIDVLDGQKEK